MQIKKYQSGGAAPAAPQQAPEAAGQEQVMQQIAQMANDIISQIGPDAAAMLAQVIMEMLQSGAQEPVGAAPQEQQFMRCGGKITKMKNKACKK